MPRFAVIGRILASAGTLFAFAFPVLRFWGAPAAPAGRLVLAAAGIALAGGMLTGLLYLSSQGRARDLRRRVESLLYNGPGEPALPPTAHEMDALAESLDLATRRVRVVVEALQRESARLEAILSSMVEGVVAVDPLLRITFVNRAFAEMMGAALPVAPGTPLLQVTRDHAFFEIFNAVFSGGQPVQKRLILSAAARSFEVQVAPLAGDPQRGAIAMLYDITDLERLERVRKDFVANVSHELRTPLAAVCGYAETLRESVLDDPENSRQFAEIILAKARQLANIVTDLLIVSSLEGGKPPAPQPISLRESIECALRTVEPAAKARGVRLVCGSFADLSVLGHDIRLEQVWVNLLENAIKFNRPEGEVRVDVARGAECALVHVRDTGLGIPSRDLPRIFERFYRVDKARSRATGGTGLGLAIVKHAVEQMGGSVSVESRVGHGSVFTVALPSCENNHSANGF
jgi:two-component system phosphate regulon sensor histidine kinase PhoR